MTFFKKHTFHEVNNRCPKTYPGSFPLHASGFGWARSQLIEPEWFRCGRKGRVAEELSAAQALAPERLEVLVQVFRRVGVGTKACGQCPLLGQCGCYPRHGAFSLRFAVPPRLPLFKLGWGRKRSSCWGGKFSHSSASTTFRPLPGVVWHSFLPSQSCACVQLTVGFKILNILHIWRVKHK